MTGVCLLAGAGYLYSQRPRPVRYVTAAVDRGDIVDVVGATGALQAVTTRAGRLAGLGHHPEPRRRLQLRSCKKGQVIARLDPSTFEARLGQAQANLVGGPGQRRPARRPTVEDTEQKYERAQELAAEQLLPAERPRDARSATYEGAVAQAQGERRPR